MGRRFLFLLILGLYSTNSSAQSPESISPQDIAAEYRSQLERSEDTAAAFSELFEIGFSKSSSDSSVEAAERNIRKILKDDPAFEYASALIWLKRNEAKGMQRLQECLGADKAPYSPGWKAKIYYQLKRRQYASGFEDLEKFSSLQPNLKEKQSAQTLENAYWVGNIIGGIQYQLTSSQYKRYQETFDRIQNNLSEELQQELRAGIEGSRALHDSLYAEAYDKSLESQQEENEKLADQKGELRFQTRKLDLEDRSLQISGEELKKKFEEASSQNQKDFEKVLSEIPGIVELGTRLEATIQELIRQQSEITLLEQAHRALKSDPKANENQRNVYGTVENIEKRLTNLYQQQRYLPLAQAEYQKTTLKFNSKRYEGMQIMQKQQTMINEYQKLTGQIVDKANAIEDKQGVLEKEMKHVEKKRDNNNNRALLKQLKYLSTYFKIEPEAESQYLIRGHSPPASESVLPTP